MKEQIQQEQIKSQEQISKELIEEVFSFPDLIHEFHLQISKIIDEQHLDEKSFKLIEEKSIALVDKLRFKLLDKIESNLGKDSNMYELVAVASGDLLFLTTSIDDIKENPQRNSFNEVLNETKEKFEMAILAIKVGENPYSKVSDEQE